MENVVGVIQTKHSKNIGVVEVKTGVKAAKIDPQFPKRISVESRVH